jgi:hypothetical protein
MGPEEYRKKEAPFPLQRALDENPVPRAVSPLKRFAIPAAVVIGLTVTSASVALALNIDDARWNVNGEHRPKSTSLNPLDWLKPDPEPGPVAGGIQAMPPSPPLSSASDAGDSEAGTEDAGTADAAAHKSAKGKSPTPVRASVHAQSPSLAVAPPLNTTGI